MKYNPKTLAWAVGLALVLVFASAPPAQAQQCSSICNANVDCSTSCVDGLTVQGEIRNETTCGDAGFPCCNTTTTTTLYCTGQFLKEDLVCVQVERDLITTTCGSNSHSTIVGQRQRSPGGNCQTCPTEHTAGCEDLVSPICG